MHSNYYSTCAFNIDSKTFETNDAEAVKALYSETELTQHPSCGDSIKGFPISNVFCNFSNMNSIYGERDHIDVFRTPFFPSAMQRAKNCGPTREDDIHTWVF